MSNPKRDKCDHYRSAKIKVDAPSKHAGEFVAIKGRVNGKIFFIHYIGQDKNTPCHECDTIHVDFLERFCI